MIFIFVKAAIIQVFSDKNILQFSVLVEKYHCISGVLIGGGLPYISGGPDFRGSTLYISGVPDFRVLELSLCVFWHMSMFFYRSSFFFSSWNLVSSLLLPEPIWRQWERRPGMAAQISILSEQIVLLILLSSTAHTHIIVEARKKCCTRNNGRGVVYLDHTTNAIAPTTLLELYFASYRPCFPV